MLSITLKLTQQLFPFSIKKGFYLASQGPHSYILMTGGGGGGPSDFLGSEILAKSDFLGSMKNAEIFLGREKKTGIFLGMPKK